MSRTPASIWILRVLVVFLIAVVIIVSLVTYVIQDKSRKNIEEAAQILYTKDKPLEILDLCLQQMYEVDNDFRLYTLSFRKEPFELYKKQLKRLDSLTVALETSFASVGSQDNPAYSIQSGTKQKEVMFSDLARLRKMADSLLINANSLQSLHEENVIVRMEVKRYNPDLTALSVDTIDLTQEQTKQKKGLFSKIKTFFVGEKQKSKIHRQITVKSGTQSGAVAADGPVTMADIGKEVASQTSNYYEEQLKAQYLLNEKIKEKEKGMIELNSRIISNIAVIFNKLKQENLVRQDKIHTLAVVNILKNYYIVQLCLLVGIALTILFAILIALNIRKIIRYQKGIIAARHKAEAETIEKSRFLSYMSHELRTPLTSIIGFTEQLRDSSLNPDQQKYIQAMTNSSDVLLITINDILDLSKLESGKFRFMKYSFLVKPVFEQVLNSLRPLAAKKGMTIELVVNLPETTCFLGDEIRLKQVLINLVNNAIKYSDKGTITVTISVTVSRGKSRLLVDVADQGIGIDENKLNEVFSEFSQVHDESAKKWIIGTGLGLPICKKIVEQQGGEIWVKSSKGEGSTFSFRIPYQTFIGKPEAAEPEITSFDPGIFRLKEILVADDTEINLILLDSIFRKWGVTIDRARNGSEALALFKSKTYHMVLSDVYMPEMDGMELTGQIRHSFLPGSKEIPIIILTANLIQDEIERFRLAGVTDYLVKPFRTADLYRVVSRHLK